MLITLNVTIISQCIYICENIKSYALFVDIIFICQLYLSKGEKTVKVQNKQFMKILHVFKYCFSFF